MKKQHKLSFLGIKYIKSIILRNSYFSFDQIALKFLFLFFFRQFYKKNTFRDLPYIANRKHTKKFTF